MRIESMGRGIAIAFAVALATGCPGGGDGGTDVVQADPGPDTAVPDVPQDTGSDVGTDTPVTPGQCLQCLQPGLAFRFSMLNVLEPSEPMGLPEFLNAIWAPDIADSRLNIVMRIVSIEDAVVEGKTKKHITVSGGSAWHEMTKGTASTVDDVLEVGGGKTPAEYYFIEGAISDFVLELEDDCTFKSIGDAALKFHPGPLDHALICSGGDETLGFARDQIPMAKLIATGKFNDTCTEVGDAYLQGCIAQPAACQICSFGPAPDYSLWKMEPDATAAGTACEPSYCAKNCAKGLWVNFGGFVRDLGVPLQCDYNGSGSNNGYMIAGGWAAKAVPFGDAPAE